MGNGHLQAKKKSVEKKIFLKRVPLCVCSELRRIKRGFMARETGHRLLSSLWINLGIHIYREANLREILEHMSKIREVF